MFDYSKLLYLLFVCIFQNKWLISLASSSAPTPIVLWHGMGDSCCFSFSLGAIKNILEENIAGVYVKSIRIGNNEIQDVEKSYLGNINDQIATVCNELSQDRQLQNGYNAIGFSQGAQFLRAVAQRCLNPPMLNLISMGGQHQGVYGLPRCSALHHAACNYIRKMLYYGAYLRITQETFVQASYWHDPLHEMEYQHKNLFLADINNEIYLNTTYRDNLMRLQSLVLVMFSNDTMVSPRQSEWFGFYSPGQTIKIQDLVESDLYQKDRIGLKNMDESGKLHFLTVEGDHLQFTDTWFVNNIIKKYL